MRVGSNPDVDHDDYCLCPTGSCSCPTEIVESQNTFCVIGGSNQIGWSWQLTGLPRVDVAAQPAGGPAVLASGFAASSPLISVNGSDPTCIDVTATLGQLLSVGTFGQTPGCTVNANPSGCPFNALLFDQKVLTLAPPVPSLPFSGLAILAAALLVLGPLLLWARRRDPSPLP